MALMCSGIIYNAYAALKCECAQNWLASEFVKSTDMWLSLVMNHVGIYFPKDIPLFAVMRNQDKIVSIYAQITLALIAAGIIGLPYCRLILRTFLVVSAIFLNLRFDVNTVKMVMID